MKKRHHTKLVHEGKYVAAVDVELIDTDDGWSPYLSLEDAYKLDDVPSRSPGTGGCKECGSTCSRVHTDAGRRVITCRRIGIPGDTYLFPEYRLMPIVTVNQ